LAEFGELNEFIEFVVSFDSLRLERGRLARNKRAAFTL
jgi:hypothetical protein